MFVVTCYSTKTKVIQYFFCKASAIRDTLLTQLLPSSEPVSDVSEMLLGLSLPHLMRIRWLLFPLLDSEPLEGRVWLIHL